MSGGGRWADSLLTFMARTIKVLRPETHIAKEAKDQFVLLRKSPRLLVRSITGIAVRTKWQFSPAHGDMADYT